MLEFMLDKEFKFVIVDTSKITDSYYAMCHPQRFKTNDMYYFIKLVNRKIYRRFNYSGEYKLISYRDFVKFMNDYKKSFNPDLVEELRQEIKFREINKRPIEPATERQLNTIKVIEQKVNYESRFRGDSKHEASNYISKFVNKLDWYKKEFDNFADKCSYTEPDENYF